MVVTVSQAIETRRFRRVEYERLTEIGFFRPGERLELIDGLLVVREPQNSRHATGVRLVQQAIERAFGSGWDVRPQLPVALGDLSEPEPDTAVVPGDARDYRDAHPASPVLVVEIAESRLAFDRRDKASLYASAGIADYWVLNLVDRVLEVHRDPEPSDTAPHGFGYRSIVTLAPPSTVTPLAAPWAAIPVAELLP
jgi:Uma2 family endonuclease